MTPRVMVRTPEPGDQEAFIAAVKTSQQLHGRWIKAPSNAKAYQDFRQRMALPGNHAFLVIEKATGALVGVINLTNVIMGLFRSGYLGYYAFAGFERQGLMSSGLKLVVRHAFGKLKLHRLEANIQADNAPSIALVKRCGFQLEGYSPRYLKINGRWRDHERWAIVAD